MVVSSLQEYGGTENVLISPGEVGTACHQHVALGIN